MQRADRPVFLSLARIRFPVGAVASIAHRVSGVLLVLLLPFAVLALERSLRSEPDFEEWIGLIRTPLGRLGLLLLASACAHHLFAGIRHLLMDVGIGASLPTARRSAYAALIAAAVVGAASFLLP